jgi:hypothetical protein
MKKHMATTLGFFIAPLVGAVASSIMETVAKGLELADLPAWSLIIYFYMLIVTMIIGLPTYLFLRHLNKVRWWSAMLGGVFCGAVTFFIFNTLSPLVIPIGGLTGLVFWLIWRQGYVETN